MDIEDIIYFNTNYLVDGTFTTTTALPAEVQDSTFADVTESGFWYRYLVDWGGAAATFNVVNGALEVDITANYDQPWGVMVKQKGVSLQTNTLYRLTFTASASVDRNIEVGFALGFTKVFALTSTPATFTYDFYFTGDDITTRVEFLLGNAVAGKVILDNVELHKVMNTPAPDLFISEYVEGSSNNKAIELYNPTGAALDLTGYILTYYNNGATPDSGNVKAFDLTGITLGAGETFTIVTDTFAGTGTYDEVQAFADADSVVFFNGDDTLVLTKDGVVIDIVGVLGEDPWTLNGETIAWANNTYVRNPGITSGSTVWDPTEWTEYDQDDFSHLGSHTS